MIIKLDHSNTEVASQIYKVFQCSYKVEALLVGASNFPPLSRTANDIESSSSIFFGFNDDDKPVAVIEVRLSKKCLDICSLTVDPNWFGQGIASKLITYAMDEFEFDFEEATVETATLNTPAINLYKKHGFLEYKRWTPVHGIEKLAMSVRCVRE